LKLSQTRFFKVRASFRVTASHVRDHELPMRVTVWDKPDSEQVLRTMWKQGATAASIADVLQTSRNSVIGKVHRLGLSRDGAQQSTEPKPKAKSNPIPLHRIRKKAAAVVRPGGPVPFLKLRWFHCRAVLDRRGKDGLAMVCGEAKVDGSPWCAKHRSRFIAARVP
jgi:hypothetical protein